MILTAAQRDQWERRGYLVIHDLFARDKVRACADAIWDFLKMTPGKPADWYREPNPDNLPHVFPRRAGGLSGLVELYHHQAFWDIRQDPQLYGVFIELWGERALWVSFDRANMNPPVRPGAWDFESPFHCDVDPTARPSMLEIKTVLYLTDTPEDRGPFECVPEYHLHLDDWARPNPSAPFLPPVSHLKQCKVPGRFGDLIVFNALLPHRNSKNTSAEPRLATYTSMFPAPESAPDLQRHRWPYEKRENRIEALQKRLPVNPNQLKESNHPVGLEAARYGGTPLALSDLGQKLVGIKPWT